MSSLILLLLLLSCAAAYGLARWFTVLARDWALKHGIVSLVTHRSSHTIPTARLGGVGLALGFGVAAGLFISGFYALNIWFNSIFHTITTTINWYFLGILALGWLFFFVIGLLDDLYDLKPLVKLGLSIVAALLPALCGVAGGFWFPFSDRLPEAANTAIHYSMALFWILFFVNAFNFMDGMDGFAAGFARLAALFIFLMVLVHGEWRIMDAFLVTILLLPILAAACAGFLHWNNPPAKVFMGDGGSLSLGYLLAMAVLVGGMGYIYHTMSPSTHHITQILPPLSALTVLFPFIFDVVLTLIRRARRGENLLKAHREHLYQRLMKTGLSHAEVLKICKRTFWACNVAALLGALALHPAGRWAAFAFAVCVMLAYWRFTLRRERAQAAQ